MIEPRARVPRHQSFAEFRGFEPVVSDFHGVSALAHHFLDVRRLRGVRADLVALHLLQEVHLREQRRRRRRSLVEAKVGGRERLTDAVRR